MDTLVTLVAKLEYDLLVEQEEVSRFDELLTRYRYPLMFLVIGVVAVVVSVVGLRMWRAANSETKVEIITPATEVGGEIMAEAAGEVEKPGLYKLPTGSRINDLLVMAGGLAGKADREYVAKNINLAQKLEDGMKIFIPTKSEALISKSLPPRQASETNSNLSNTNVQNKININTATVAELDTLWGVGEATAKKIVDGRPYQKTEELLSKKIVKSNVWEAIREKVTVW